MKVYTKRTVYEAALDRIRWLFSEFDNIYVNVSGGKDSTVVLNLTLQVAEEMGRLPVNVLFIDQEAEWISVIDYIRFVMSDERVNPYWLQVPIQLFNATSTINPWLKCWDVEAEELWVREKEDISIKENVYGTDRFAPLFQKFISYMHPKESAISIAGVRAEESPARRRGLTSYETYKGETWGRFDDKRYDQLTFYPIYDWSYTDVWKAIHENKWRYCKLYDYLYQYGIPAKDMRVSNVHHETAVHTLFFLQEIEAETWERVTKRLSGINTAGQLQKEFYVHDLPVMFENWKEYRDYLLEKLIADREQREVFRKRFEAHEGRYIPKVQEELYRAEVQMILINDYHGTKYSVFHASHGLDAIKFRQKRGLPLTGRLDERPGGYSHEHIGK